MNKSPILHSFLLKFTILAFVCIGMIVLFSIYTGDFAPMQTSQLTSVGICLTNDENHIVKSIEADAEILFICGQLFGETKRQIRFDLYYDNRGIYTNPMSLNPGFFFIPIRAEDLSISDMKGFPKGNYQLRAAYNRDPIMLFDFIVENTH